MKAEFKQTVIGQIPQDWRICPLKEVAQFRNGEAHEKFVTEQGQYSLINSKFIATGGKVRKSASRQLAPLQQNDIVMVMSDIPLGKALAKCYLIEQDAIYTLNQRICALKFITPNCPRYFFYTVNRNPYFLAFDSGSGQTNLRKGEILDCPLMVPHPEEQQAIGEALSDADAWIESLETLLQKKRFIKQGSMQELLRPKEGWDQTTFDEAFYFLRTASYSRADLQSTGYAGYIHYGDIHTKWTSLLDLNKVNLPAIRENMLKSYTIVKSGDIIMADASEDYSGVGKSVEILNAEDYKIISGLHTFLLRQKSEIFSSKFMGYLIQSPFIKSQLDTLATGLKVYSISKSSLKQVQILFPLPDEQIRIATILSDMDAEIEALEHKLSKARQIKQGMMQQLLTGHIRLVKPAVQTKQRVNA